MQHRLPIVILLCSLGTAGFAGKPRIHGELCLAGEPCRDYSCGDPITSTAKSRSFVFSTSGTIARYLGVLGQNETAIPCAGYGSIALRIAADRADRGTHVRVTIRDDAGIRWEISPTEGQLKTALEIRLLPKTYQFTIERSHYRRFQTSIAVHFAETTTLLVSLEPLPTLTGMVVAPDGRAIAGAFLCTDVETTTVADANGRFTLEADPGKWPKSITISAPDYSDTTAGVPPARVSATLDRIVLNRGGTIDVDLTQREPGQVVEVDLLQRLKGGRALGRTIKSTPVATTSAQTALRFENIEPGSYVVMAKGDESWERRGEIVEVRPGKETKATLHIQPFALHVTSRMKGEALPRADVRLRNGEMRWEGNFKTDEKGERTVNLWQGGKMTAMLLADGTMPYVERRTLAEGEDLDWPFDIPVREVTGVVVDSAAGTPIPRAAVVLHVTSVDGYGMSLQAETDENGAFRFAPVAYGKHTLKAAARDYPPGEEIRYTFLEPEQARSVTIRLDAGSLSHVTVLNRNGTPVAGAWVMDFRGLSAVGQSSTDASGTATLMIADGETHDVYVIARDGSFGFVQVGSDARKTTLHLPDGSCRIVLRTESESSEPVPNVSVVMRHNGRLIPIEVIQAFASIQGSRTSSGTQGRIVLDHMPAGLYEFWPVGSPAELRALAAGVGPDAPVRMVAAPGENTAVLTFAVVNP